MSKTKCGQHLIILTAFFAIGYYFKYSHLYTRYYGLEKWYDIENMKVPINNKISVCAETNFVLKF